MRRRFVPWSLAVLAGCAGFAEAPALDGGGPADGSAPDASADVLITEPLPVPDAGMDADGGRVPRPAYAQAVLDDGPVAYWRLDEAALPPNVNDPHIRDEVSGRTTGRRVSSITFGVPGALGTAAGTGVRFESGAIVLGEIFGFAGKAPFTLEMWAHATSTRYGCLVARLDSTPTRLGYAVCSYNGGLTLERRSANRTSVAAASLPSGGFRHVVAVYDGSSVTLHVDAVAAPGSADTNELSAPTGPLVLGASGPIGTDVFAGSLDELAVYAYALSPARIRAHFDAAGK